VVPGGWSIAIEMTFYLLFPVLIITMKGNRIWYLISAIGIWIFNIFIFREWLTGFLSIHYSTSSTTIVKDYLYLNFINQAPIFLLGCYLYFSLDKTIKKVDIIALSIWLLCGIYFRIVYKIDGLGFLISYLTLAIFVYCCIKANLRMGLFEQLGKNSYAIYLTHFLVLHYLIKIAPIESGLLAFLFGIIFTTSISYVFSVVIYLLLETKVQRYVNKTLLG
jgi:exopolysaccharide production protein ExoZ